MDDNEMDLEKLLEKFISDEMEKTFMGSGDDMFYAGQVREYIRKQKRFWFDAIKTFTGMGAECERTCLQELLEKEMKWLTAMSVKGVYPAVECAAAINALKRVKKQLNAEVKNRMLLKRLRAGVKE